MSETPAPNPSPATSPQPTPNDSAPGIKKILLVVSSVLLLGWFGWLSATALTKSKEPIVSRAQTATAKVPLVAEVKTEEREREVPMVRAGGIQGQNVILLKSQVDKPVLIVTVKEQLVPNGPVVGSQIGVTNLPVSSGYTGEGEYLLLLERDEAATIEGHPAYFIVGQQRSPGADLESLGSPMIYKWGPDVRAQVKRMFP